MDDQFIREHIEGFFEFYILTIENTFVLWSVNHSLKNIVVFST